MQRRHVSGLERALRRAVAHHQRIRIERRRAAALVRHMVGDGEHVLVVDADIAREQKAVAVVPLQRHRLARRQRRAALELPRRLVVGQRLVHAGRVGPAEVDEVRIGSALGRQQHDLRALLVGGLVVILETQIVEPRALQQQRAVDRRRVDLDARPARLQRLVARQVRRRRPAAGTVPGVAAGRCRPGLFLVQQGLARLLGLHGGGGDEVLPAEQHGGRQDDGKDQIAIVVVHQKPIGAERGRSPTNRRAR